MADKYSNQINQPSDFIISSEDLFKKLDNFVGLITLLAPKAPIRFFLFALEPIKFSLEF